MESRPVSPHPWCTDARTPLSSLSQKPEVRTAASDTCHNPDKPGVMGDPQTLQACSGLASAHPEKRSDDATGLLSEADTFCRPSGCGVLRAAAFAANPKPRPKKTASVIRRSKPHCANGPVRLGCRRHEARRGHSRPLHATWKSCYSFLRFDSGALPCKRRHFGTEHMRRGGGVSRGGGELSARGPCSCVQV